MPLPAGLGVPKTRLANGRLERQEKAIDGALVPLRAGLGVPKRRLERLENLRPRKRQA